LIVEKDSSKPLQGKVVVILGTGGAARALAFGAAEKGAKVLIAGRRVEKAEELARQVGSKEKVSVTACSLEAVQSGQLEHIDVLMNTTPLGMVGKSEKDTPVPRSVLEQVRSISDNAIYRNVCATVGHCQLCIACTRHAQSTVASERNRFL
jgi:3-dehydroquinate dehydratase / shikimate dehydrogenase